MSKPDSYISVWFDDASDEHAWIVDCCDGDSSRTIKCFAVKSEDGEEAHQQAKAFAEGYSEKTGLPIR